MGEEMFWMLDSSRRMSLAMLQRSRTSASLMHSQDLSSAIYLSKSEFLELPKWPPPCPRYFVFESEPPRLRETRLSFMAMCKFAVDEPSNEISQFSKFWEFFLPWSLSVILISTFFLCYERPEAPDLILPSKPTAIESMPASWGAEFPKSLFILLILVTGPELPPMSPLPRLPDAFDIYSEAPPSLLDNIY